MTARKPTELKRALGNPGKRAMPSGLSVLAPVARDLEPPNGLGDRGSAEWRYVLEVCPWIGPSDLQNLRLYCMALERYETLTAGLAEMGYVLYTDKGYAYLNPAAGALATTEAQITKWMSLLGLTPSDRGRLGVAEVKAQTKLEELAGRREKRLAAGPRGS